MKKKVVSINLDTIRISKIITLMFVQCTFNVSCDFEMRAQQFKNFVDERVCLGLIAEVQLRQHIEVVGPSFFYPNHNYGHFSPILLYKNPIDKPQRPQKLPLWTWTVKVNFLLRRNLVLHGLSNINHSGMHLYFQRFRC